jgi:nucleoside-diphosphate-sugar epimerase
MRLFVTGASGWIGSAVVPELLAAGHEIVGLARSDAAAQTIEDLGARVARGSLEDLDVLAAAAGAADGVVHLGFVHEFDRYEAALAIDRAAIAAMGGALAGRGGPLLIASGVPGARPDGTPGAEADRPGPGHPRADAAEDALAFADRGVRSIVVRYPPTVHGEGDSGFVRWLADRARERGRSGFPGEGTNRWPAVHRVDAARATALALEAAPAGTVVHAVAEEGIPVRVIAEAIGDRLELPSTSIPSESALEELGFVGMVASLDLAATSTATRERLGWEPTGPTLLDDIAAGHYGP